MKSAAALVLVLATAAACGSNPAPSQPEMVSYPNRTIAEWGKDEALREAEADIKAGRPKLYISGTIAAFPHGLSPEEMKRLRGLPMADAGIGCVIKDEQEAQLRRAQTEYAETYNRYVAEHYQPQ